MGGGHNDARWRHGGVHVHIPSPLVGRVTNPSWEEPATGPMGSFRGKPCEATEHHEPYAGGVIWQSGPTLALGRHRRCRDLIQRSQLSPTQPGRGTRRPRPISRAHASRPPTRGHLLRVDSRPMRAQHGSNDPVWRGSTEAAAVRTSTLTWSGRSVVFASFEPQIARRRPSCPPCRSAARRCQLASRSWWTR